MHKKEAKRKQKKVKQLNRYKFLPTEKWYEDRLRDWSQAKLNWDKIIDKMWITFLEEEDQ